MTCLELESVLSNNEIFSFNNGTSNKTAPEQRLCISFITCFYWETLTGNFRLNFCPLPKLYSPSSNPSPSTPPPFPPPLSFLLCATVTVRICKPLILHHRLFFLNRSFTVWTLQVLNELTATHFPTFSYHMLLSVPGAAALVILYRLPGHNIVPALQIQTTPPFTAFASALLSSFTVPVRSFFLGPRHSTWFCFHLHEKYDLWWLQHFQSFS